MEWIETDGAWKRGSYTIELAAPELWVLSRDSDAPEGAVIVEAEALETGRSLKAMKRRAEILAADAARRRSRKRWLWAIVAGLALLATVSGSPGVVATVVGFGAGGLIFFGLVRFLDRSLKSRPWERLSQTYQ